ncbi:MAG: TetR/AcrR family transcriptional regulator C-terminal domain-containing protein [Verrucomicrobiota bacterium JB023]|nr:TetR/AcrR family transcriptional regulator C-terminal domain-containing protein [Verrucomicrobiota bacterium JB023]
MQKQLEELAHRYVEVVSDENFMGLARVVLREKVGQPELSKEKFERIRRGQTGLGEWMREAARQNALELANPAEDARRFSAMLSEFAFWPQLFSGQPPMNGEEKERVIAETVRLFLRGKGCRDGEGEAEER